MNILVIGSGGREHALIWALQKSAWAEKIYCAPGNGGIAYMAECVNIDVTDFKGLIRFVEKNDIHLTVVGPELPLTLGIVDAFKNAGLTIFGPDKKAAELEGSKKFAKDLMAKYHIPTADYRTFTDPDEAIQYIQKTDPPLVLKADGLAAGKGVLVCQNRKEAFDGVVSIMKEKNFGPAGKTLVVEECLAGEEASVLAITDGEDIVLLPPAQDHKAIFEGDKGPNTGGMGAYAPAPVITPALLDAIREKIILRTIRGMKEEGRPYKGVLYAGIMVTREGPKVLEYNCRFGDPEIQAILPLLDVDIVDLMLSSINGKVGKAEAKISNKAAVCVVMASGGYPGSYDKGKVIHGLNKLPPDIMVYQAGTKLKGDDLLTSGGRVLGVTAVSDDIESAIKKVYQSIGMITFDGAYYRKDIGQKALRRGQ